MSKLSIIIPMYNAEDTIIRCLLPIIDHDDVEVICIDDGSIDHTYSIISDYVSCHVFKSRITVLTQKNQGASEARNQGLSKATGDYVLFCDADDSYSDNTVDELLSVLSRFNDLDLIVFKRVNCYPDGHNTPIIYDNGIKLIEKNWCDYVNSDFITRQHSVSVINKVYRNDIIKKHMIRFDSSLSLSEDLLFNLLYFPYCKKIVEDYDCEYLRYLQKDSLTNSKRVDFFSDETKAITKYKENYNENFIKIIPYYSHSICNSIIQALQRYCMHVDGTNFKDRISSMKLLVNNNEFRECFLRLDRSMESPYFLKQIDIAYKKKVYCFYFKYGSLWRIKKQLRPAYYLIRKRFQ